jgi:dTDP-glucose 4,6-dehydratase
MRVLVTGGAGFIGSNFVRRTLATRPGVEIVVLDALTYAGRLSNLAGLDGQFEFVHGNICDENLVDSLVGRVDAVIHFAAESHNDNSLKDARPFIETNVMGTFNLIQACVKHGVRFHHVSTDEVFGDLPLVGEGGFADVKFDRETPYAPSSPYSASKASSDLLVRAWVRSFGLLATISNCSNNYGPWQHEEKLIPRTILLAASGVKPKVYGAGVNVRDWIHVDDHNDGVWAVLDRGVIGETYLLGANGERSNLQVVRAILDALGLPEDFMEFVGDRPGHDLRYAIDASATVAELGWQPAVGSFEAGLPAVVDFYVSQLKAGVYSSEVLARLGVSGLSTSV